MNETEAKPEAPAADPPPAKNDPAAKLATVEQQRDEYLNLLRQTRADFENYQKRLHRDLQDERRYCQQPLAGELLPILDNLERALSAARQAGEQGALVQGVALVQTQLLDALRRHGVTPIEAKDQPFDPNHHQAVMQRAQLDVAAGQVLDVLQQGFLIHDRVLRPASVVVSSSPA